MQVFTRRLVTDWTLLQMPDHDVAIIGGGLLGSAFGWGLAQKGLKPVIFDEGDAAIRTARGNFGLVWVQGKGQSMPEYAAWSFRASQLWTDFAQELKDNTGVDVHYLKGNCSPRYAARSYCLIMSAAFPSSAIRMASIGLYPSSAIESR